MTMANTMQPKSSAAYDKEAFDRIKMTAKHTLIASKGTGSEAGFQTELPLEVGLQLTNRCNLRCRHCFQWNDNGYLNKNKNSRFKEAELPFEVVEKILEETKPVKSSLYLWGGEPTYYSHWDRLAKLLENDRRNAVVCTNGILLKDKLDSILPISENLVLLISLEGFEEENDSLRGSGKFNAVMANIDRLLEMRKNGAYKGKISVECVVNDAMVSKLHAFMRFLEEKGIDAAYICFPWYISPAVAEKMDMHCEAHFKSLYDIKRGEASWHSYTYHLEEDRIEELKSEIEKINKENWKIRVRFQPFLKEDEIRGFITGSDVPAQNRKKCYSVAYRMDVLANGTVSPCKLFPEFAVGDLNKSDVKSVWKSERFKEFRKSVGDKLTPVCSKCVLLYLHGS